jgi:DNA repair protein RadC
MENTNEFAQYQVAEVQLVYKSKMKPSKRPKITSSREAQQIFMSCWDDTKLELAEQFKVMLLNRAHKVLGIFELSTGGIGGTVADPRLIFAAALKGVASGIILAHNHPTGNLQPSQSEIDLTRKLKEEGQFLEILVMDHVILTTEGYYCG